MAKHNVEMVVTVTDRGSGTWEKLSGGSDKATRSSRKYAKSIARMQSELIRLNTQRDVATDPRRVRELNREIAKTERAIGKAKGGVGALGGAMGNLGKIGVAAVAVGVGRALVSVGKSAVAASGEMEKYNVTLKTMLGSSDAARERMGEYMDVAKKTPFEMSQVVDAGNQLQAIGRYSRSNLVMLGDLAAATGKPLEQVLGAYAKLATGQKGEGVNMFRDLLISSRDWMAATGKGMAKNGSLTANTEEMLKALPKILDKKGFTGLMDAQAETTEGKVSNLKDAVYGLNAAIGERMQPTVKSVTGWLTEMAGSMEGVVEIPMEDKIAREKVELNYLVEGLMGANANEAERGRQLAELNRKYPEFLKNIDLEKGGNEALRAKLAEVNKEYEKKMRNAALSRQLDALDEQMGEAMDDVAKYEMSLAARKNMTALAAREKQLTKGFANVYVADNGEIRYRDSGELAAGASAKTKAYAAERKANRKLLTAFGNDAKRKQRAAEKYKQYNAQRNLVMGSMTATDDGSKGAEGASGSATAGGAAGGGAGLVGSAGMGGGSTGSGGGGGGRNVTTTIGTLVGTININTTNMQEGAAEIKRLVAQALTDAIPVR